MSEPSPKLEAALQHVAPEWDEARTSHTLEGIADRRAKRRARTAAIAGSCALLALGVAGALSLAWPMADTAAEPALAAPWRKALEFADGSRVYVRDDRSQVVVARAEGGLTEVALTRGRARFVITPKVDRRFRVVAGEVAVEVLGTIFDVERATEGVRVEVERGRVAVNWSGGRTELGAGEARLFARGEEAPAQDSQQDARGKA